VIRGSSWWRHDAAAQRFSLTLHIQPNAKKAGIAGLHGDALKIRIAAPAVDNKANAALVEFLSGALEVSKSAIAIRQGATGRRKIVDIYGDDCLLLRLKAIV
jgi:uncharacterized protein (TIGR00251 family)